MKYVLSLSILFCLLFFSCKSQKEPQTVVVTADTKVEAKLMDVKWMLTKLNGDVVNLSKTELEQPFIKLTAKDSGVGGTGGCNAFGGTFILKNNQHIEFSQMLATMKYCNGNGIETVFMANLRKATSYTITNNELTFKDENGYVLSTFEPIKDIK